MGGRGSSNTFRNESQHEWDIVTGWDIKNDNIEDDATLKRFLEGLAVVGPTKWEADWGIEVIERHPSLSKEFIWNETKAEARFQAMIAAQREELITKTAIIAGLAEFILIASIATDIYWYYDKKLHNQEEARDMVRQQLKDWLIEDNLNPNSTAEDMYKEYVKYHQDDMENLIEWMKENGFEDMLP